LILHEYQGRLQILVDEEMMTFWGGVGCRCEITYTCFILDHHTPHIINEKNI